MDDAGSRSTDIAARVRFGEQPGEASTLANDDDIKKLILGCDRVAAWPEMAAMVRRGGAPSADSIPCWHYPELACEALGGEPSAALPAMAAITCLLNGIHLLDDLLDEDADGLQHRLGVGTTANLATAFHAVASQLMAEAELPTEVREAALRRVAAATLDTAWGQHLDSRPQRPEDAEASYWQITATKTPPLFAAAFYLGALCGGADLEAAQNLATLAHPIGKVIQCGDDMSDALARPAKPDWRRSWTNLVLLYAQLAEHPERRRLATLMPQVDEAAALEEAQAILVRCGAISFGCYHVIAGYRDACRSLRQLPLVTYEPLGRLLESLIQPTRRLFARHDIAPPPDLRQRDLWRPSGIEP